MAKKFKEEPIIFKRKDGLWSYSISIGIDSETGKLIRKTVYGKTKQEVIDKLDEIKNSLMQSTANNVNYTLSEWLDIWLFEYIKSSIRPTTFNSYESLSRIHIKPHIGDINLTDLKAEHIQKLYNEKIQKGRFDGLGGLSSRTIRYIHFILSSAPNHAVKIGILDNNVSEATILPRKESKELRVLTLAEQKQFLSALTGERLYAAFILCLSTGLRQGELLALR